MTLFEQAVKAAREGNLQTPSVSVGTKPISYFKYQLVVHKFNLNIMAGGMTCRGIKFTDIKKYYGLKGRKPKDCVEQLNKILTDFEEGKI